MIIFPPEYPYTSGTTKVLRDNFADLQRERNQYDGEMPEAASLYAAFSAGVGRVTPAAAQEANGKVEVIKSVCTHCSVGCGVVAEIQNGVWTGQEPAFDNPINRGAHCAKGASVREHGHGERRLKYPMKKVGGKWTKISWDQAIGEIGDQLLEIREKSSPDCASGRESRSRSQR